VKLIVRADSVPDMPTVMERLINPLKGKDLIVKLTTFVEVANVHRGVIKLQPLRGR